MSLKSSSFLTAVYYLIFFIVNFLTLNHSLALSELSNEISINCGSSTIFNGNDGRKWIGDIGSKLLVNYQNSQAKSIRSKLSHFSDTIPYTTARISYKQFSYEIDVGLGQKFIRLYFYPTMYKGFERSNDFFTVKAGPFTLLSNFSASLTVDALGVRFLMKEFCINVEEHQLLTVMFSPSTGADKGKAYAFVNGIEIISMPSGLYYTPVDEPAMQVVGKKHQLSVDEGIALEMVYRLNIGGISIPSTEDTGLFREWGDDSNYLVNSDVRPVSTSNKIKYKSIANYTAPQKVYQTSWATVLTKQVDKVNNFTWKLPLDSGFRYLIRFHFCELEYDIEENSHLRFSILINNQVAEANVDLIKWSGGSGIAISKNYVAVMEGDRMEGKRQLLISLTPKWSNNEEWWTESSDTILKGLEVFKLSNTDYNLAGVNPVPLTQALSSSIRTPRKFVYANGGSSISTIIIVLISLVSIIVYQLRIRGEKYGDDKISISPSKGVSRHFSLAEIRTATNNFDKMLVIGKGGFGLVYKGVINCGAITVALKRLNSKSNQGAIEFWTEIDMLSKLRHTHLVSLLGYCDEDGEMILVYEYMENGTLADHLHKISSNGGDDLNLSWEQRLKICIGAARGLDYLHTGTQHGVIHRDVKTTNILLDDKLVAKISDFGLCKVGPTSHSYTHVSTNVKGTFGYFDPEYFLTHRLTTKSDVYAFGVVLLEVLSGRRAVDLSFGEDQSSLVFWAQQCIKEGKINELIGPSLRDQISSSCLKIFTEVACKCLHNRPNGRPTMFDVVVSLEGALTSQNCMSDIVQLDGALQQGTIPSSTTHIRDVENIRQEKKISKGMLVNAFQWSLRLLTKKSSGSTSDDEKNNHHLSYRRFTIKEIRAATNNFNSNLRIDEDSFGTMYKGRIDRGTLKVMIKSTQKPLEVDKLLTPRAEIKSQSQLNHPNILSLLGYCADKDNLMLVYNYMVNRSLDYNLFKVRLHDPLSWTKRLEICIGAAKGLQYLHYGTTEQIIHRDVKPSNILLDENWVAKISGFELSKVAVSDHMSTCVPGTSGLLDPEYASTGHLTKKTDVYAFGGVLLEVLCARKPYRPSQDEEKFSLVRWFRTCIQREKINQLIDPYLIGRISPECLMQYLKVAWDCLLDQGAKRPTMNSVVQNLQIALQLQQIWHTDCIPSVNGRVYNDKLASQHSSFFDHSGIYVQGEGQVIACHSIEEWKENLEKNNDKLVVVDFFASWCGPCRVIAPFLAELAKKLPNVTFLKVDVDELQAVAEEMKVEAMPTFLFMKEGKVVDTVVGAVKEKLQQTISKHSGSASALEQNPF